MLGIFMFIWVSNLREIGDNRIYRGNDGGIYCVCL